MPTVNELYTNVLSKLTDISNITQVLVTQTQSLNETQKEIKGLIDKVQDAQSTTEVSLAVLEKHVSGVDKEQTAIRKDVDVLKKEHTGLMFDNSHSKSRWSRITDTIFKIIQTVIICYALYKLGIKP